MDEGPVFVGFGFRVRVAAGVHGIKIKVEVGLGISVMVFVADAIAVGAGEDVDVLGGSGVPVVIVTPGVRKSRQPGSVSMEGSTGSIKPSGLPATKVAFGSICDFISVFSCQLEAKRNAI